MPRVVSDFVVEYGVALVVGRVVDVGIDEVMCWVDLKLIVPR